MDILIPEISEHNPRGTIQKINIIYNIGVFQIVPLGLCSEISSIRP